jgi:hypothetical protein
MRRKPINPPWPEPHGEHVPAGYILTLDTDHFSFEAHGRTEEEANEAMGRTLDAHGKQYRLPADWSDPYLDGFETRLFLPGVGTRDGEEIR